RGGISAAIFETIKDFFGQVISVVTGECKPNTIGDVNCDGRVDLVDFSILAFWQGKSNPPRSVDVSGNGAVGLADFSIVAHHWTDPEVLGKKVVRVDAQKNEVYTLLFTASPDELSFGNDFAHWRIGEEENGIARYQISSSDVFARNQNNEGLDSVAAALPAIVTNHGMWIIISMIILGIGILWRYGAKFKM
ncbi:MAG: dockerin type I domain-containing protein, partial [Patescibacteria group bacterium]